MKKIINAFNKQGYQLYLVGGAVRDMVMGVLPHDYDFTTDALPDEIIKVVKESFGDEATIFELGKKFGTIAIEYQGERYEITTMRKDSNYTDNRHPDSVVFTDSLLDDLHRRDFTMNAIAYDGRTYIDPIGGQEDIENGLIRAVGKPRKRFLEDSLRIIRAIRFQTIPGMRVEEETLRAMQDYVDILGCVKVANERILTELTIMAEKKPQLLIQTMPFVTSLNKLYIKMKGFNQHNHNHDSDLLTHTERALTAYGQMATLFCGINPNVSFALLLHDIGKTAPGVQTFDDVGEAHYYDHAKVSSEMVEIILTELRMSEKNKQEVLWFIKHHHDFNSLTEHNFNTFISKYIKKYGKKKIFDLATIFCADVLAQNLSDPQVLNRLTLAYKAMSTITAAEDRPAFTLKELAVNGNDIMAELDIKPGKKVGILLHKLYTMVLNNEIKNEKTALLNKLKEL